MALTCLAPCRLKVKIYFCSCGCSLIQIDSGESTSAEARPREAAASQNTAACIEACRLDELFADSKFLRAESLIELVKAIMWAAGPVNRIAASGEESDTAEVRSNMQRGHCSITAAN